MALRQIHASHHPDAPLVVCPLKDSKKGVGSHLPSERASSLVPAIHISYFAAIFYSICPFPLAPRTTPCCGHFYCFFVSTHNRGGSGVQMAKFMAWPFQFYAAWPHLQHPWPPPVLTLNPEPLSRSWTFYFWRCRESNFFVFLFKQRE